VRNKRRVKQTDKNKNIFTHRPPPGGRARNNDESQARKKLGFVV
jgi:hypothetical protein